MYGYTKLFQSIVGSTIWREDLETKVVWITMLALKNHRHIVEASVPGLADLARVSLEACERSLKKLSSPDKYSRSQEFEGRRIRAVDGGWLILNGEKYSQMLKDRSEYQREYYRKKKGRGPQGRERIYEQAAKNGEDTDGILRETPVEYKVSKPRMARKMNRYFMAAPSHH